MVAATEKENTLEGILGKAKEAANKHCTRYFNLSDVAEYNPEHLSRKDTQEHP